LLLALAFIGFISLGLPDAVIGVAWPSVRDTFHLPQSAVGVVLVISGLGYLLSSFFAGRMMQTFGIGIVLAVSTGLVAAAMFGFGYAPIWAAFLLCALIHGLGSGAIDSGLNGYAAHHMSARQVIWLHACYCFGALIGPIVMSTLLASGRHYSAGYSGGRRNDAGNVDHVSDDMSILGRDVADCRHEEIASECSLRVEVFHGLAADGRIFSVHRS
jgi:fucose permease